MCPLTNAEHLARCRENISPVDRCNAPFHAAFYARTLQFSPVKGMSLVFQGSRARTRAWYAPGNPTAERYNRSRYDWQILLSRLSAYCFAYHIFLPFFLIFLFVIQSSLPLLEFPFGLFLLFFFFLFLSTFFSLINRLSVFVYFLQDYRVSKSIERLYCAKYRRYSWYNVY